MSRFGGKLWLASDPRTLIAVQVQVDRSRIRIVSNGRVIGDWHRSEVKVEVRGDEGHIFAEGEELVVAPDEPGAASMLTGVQEETYSPPPVVAPPPPPPTHPPASSVQAPDTHESGPRPPHRGAHVRRESVSSRLRRWLTRR